MKIVLCRIIIFSISLDAIPSFAERKIEEALTSTAVVQQNEQPTAVIFTVRLAADRDRPTLVEAIRLDEQGGQTAQLGELYDDGTHGDIARGDNIYTAQITINEPRPSVFLWRAVVRYADQGTPLAQVGQLILVQANQSCTDALSSLATKLDAGDLKGAAESFEDVADRKVIESASDLTRRDLAKDLREARKEKEDKRSCVFSVPVTENGVRRSTRFLLIRTPLGDWQIASW